MTVLRGLRSGLDFLYLAAGVLAALCLIAILGLIVVQMLARWTGEVFPGAPDYAGYAMAAIMPRWSSGRLPRQDAIPPIRKRRRRAGPPIRRGTGCRL